MHDLTQFATTQTNIFTSLGIDWQMLILQIVAFLLLVFALGKWVYPWLMKSVDERQAKIEEAAKAAAEAQASAEAAEKKMAALLHEARTNADAIVATAKLEATTLVEDSVQKARKHAEQIIEGAKADIDKEVVAAKKALHNETIELVALATEKVTHKIVSDKVDEALIKESLELIGKTE